MIHYKLYAMLNYMSMTNLNLFKILQNAKKTRSQNNKQIANRKHIFIVLLTNRNMAGMNDR